MSDRLSSALFFACALSVTPTLAVAGTDDLSQPIKVSADGHFLVQPDGKPFFWLADTAWELFDRLTREETEVYLRDRGRKGFNVVQAVATGELDFAGLQTPNRYGEVPFIDGDPAKPNSKYFEHIDWVVQRAAGHGIRIAMLPAWGAFFVSRPQSRVFTTANAEVYGRWLGQRYRGKGIIWVLGGDTNPIAAAGDGNDEFSTVVDHRPVYDAMARGIVAGEGGDPFITYHPTIGGPSAVAPPRMSLYFRDRTWFDMSMLQSGHAQLGSGDYGGGSYLSPGAAWGFAWNAVFNYVPVFEEYKATPARPVIDAEPRYEASPLMTGLESVGDHVEIKAKGLWSAHHARSAIYHCLFAGAAGHTYGHFSLWNLYDSRQPGRSKGMFDQLLKKFPQEPWQRALDAEGAGQMQHAKGLLLSRPYFTRIPDQSVVIGEVGEGETHIGATRERTGAYVMVYLPQGQPVTVDLSKLSGTSAVSWWFDPRSGKATRMEGTLPTNQPQRFTPPTSGSDQDWVLILDDASKHFSIPAH